MHDLLQAVREEAIATNINTGGAAYAYVAQEIRKDARAGAEKGNYVVTDFPHAERSGALQALKMQGFNAGFDNESHGSIWVSWVPRHPRQ